jgi:beta-phosphoglucomutase-like phosphatase (HAD superfamily)
MPIIDAIVTAQGWAGRFPLRCSADAVPNGKPAPDVYLRAAQMLGVEPSDCLALEDSVTGARAAVAAGMVCYGVPDVPRVDPARLREVTPHIYESLHQVLDVLRA